ncbi:MAG: plastocyanin/azurin family copper-binding protein [Syntrophomonadaceae bacterium]
MASLRAARLAFALLFAAVALGCDDTMTGPSATPTPSAPTPTPSAAHAVYVGQAAGGARANVFVDAASGTSTTTIHAGETVQWVWVSGAHSTTSGVCPLGCVADGLWDSGVVEGTTFQHTFPSSGTFPYFCLVHGAMMQGSVVVQ